MLICYYWCSSCFNILYLCFDRWIYYYECYVIDWLQERGCCLPLMFGLDEWQKEEWEEIKDKEMMMKQLRMDLRTITMEHAFGMRKMVENRMLNVREKCTFLKEWDSRLDRRLVPEMKIALGFVDWTDGQISHPLLLTLSSQICQSDQRSNWPPLLFTWALGFVGWTGDLQIVYYPFIFEEKVHGEIPWVANHPPNIKKGSLFKCKGRKGSLTIWRTKDGYKAAKTPLPLKSCALVSTTDPTKTIGWFVGSRTCIYYTKTLKCSA